MLEDTKEDGGGVHSWTETEIHLLNDGKPVGKQLEEEESLKSEL